MHFNNNDNAGASDDRFFKVRPVFDIFIKNCKTLPETPRQSVDEVMVAYKGTRAGNLRQYISTKPDKWGFKLFCRASSDGIIHDIIMYQGTTTFNNHGMKLTDLENKMNLGSKLVVALVKTLKNPELSTVYADNYFSSLDLASYLKQKFACGYTGTIRENRIGLPNLRSTKEMNRSSVPRGTIDFKSKNGIVVVRWKDNKVVTLLSTDCGIHPISSIQRYDKSSRAKKGVQCPHVIQKYNANMGGIDKSDMLTHLYKSPLRARRWYLHLFGYIVDLAVCNAWLLYKRDCVSLCKTTMPLKNFRLEISSFARSKRPPTFRAARYSLAGASRANRMQHQPLDDVQFFL